MRRSALKAPRKPPPKNQQTPNDCSQGPKACLFVLDPRTTHSHKSYQCKELGTSKPNAQPAAALPAALGTACPPSAWLPPWPWRCPGVMWSASNIYSHVNRPGQRTASLPGFAGCPFLFLEAPLDGLCLELFCWVSFQFFVELWFGGAGNMFQQLHLLYLLNHMRGSIPFLLAGHLQKGRVDRTCCRTRSRNSLGACIRHDANLDPCQGASASPSNSSDSWVNTSETCGVPCSSPRARNMDATTWLSREITAENQTSLHGVSISLSRGYPWLGLV